MMEKRPPRRMLDGMMRSNDPKWNEYGSCDSSGGTNSCTYIQLKKRITSYSKYAFEISIGSKDFSKLGMTLNAGNWDLTESLLTDDTTGMPPPVKDALLKLVLFASGMLKTPN